MNELIILAIIGGGFCALIGLYTLGCIVYEKLIKKSKKSIFRIMEDY